MAAKLFVLGFMFSEDRDKVILIRKNKPASLEGHWNGIGGKVEKYEPFEDAMVREFREEVGIETSTSDWEHCLKFTGDDSSFGEFHIAVYRAFGNVWQFQQMEDEVPAVFFLAHPPSAIVPNLRWMLPLLADRRVTFPLDIHQS